MLNPWIASQKLLWNSDWNGDEVGYDNIPVVGLYSVKGMDTENGQILEIFCSKDHEYED